MSVRRFAAKTSIRDVILCLHGGLYSGSRYAVTREIRQLRLTTAEACSPRACPQSAPLFSPVGSWNTVAALRCRMSRVSAVGLQATTQTSSCLRAPFERGPSTHSLNHRRMLISFGSTYILPYRKLVCQNTANTTPRLLSSLLSLYNDYVSAWLYIYCLCSLEQKYFRARPTQLLLLLPAILTVES